MKKGQHMTEEQKARCSAGQTGRIASPETRAKMSTAQIGNKYGLGRSYEASAETRAKISTAKKGKPNGHLGMHRSLEARVRMSVTHIGRVASDEARVNMSIAAKNMAPEARAKVFAIHWKGGLVVSRRKSKAKRRTLGFIPLNPPFAGCEGHHVDEEQVIHLPKILHRSIYHNHNTGRGMAQMNAIAYNFLFKQEVEVAMATKETRS